MVSVRWPLEINAVEANGIPARHQCPNHIIEIPDNTVPALARHTVSDLCAHLGFLDTGSLN